MARLPWTPLSRRTGMATGYSMQYPKPDIVPYLQEAGIYLAFFKQEPVKPGDSWEGSTTATGGCTSGTFTFKGVQTSHGKTFANLEVTKIMFVQPTVEQAGPMRMLVDLSTGLPKVVDYKVRDRKTGSTTHFRQTLVG